MIDNLIHDNDEQQQQLSSRRAIPIDRHEREEENGTQVRENWVSPSVRDGLQIHNGDITTNQPYVPPFWITLMLYSKELLLLPHAQPFGAIAAGLYSFSGYVIDCP